MPAMFWPISVQDTPPSRPESVFSPASSTISTPTPLSLADNEPIRPPLKLTCEEEEKALGFFKASTLSQRNKDTKSWVWKYGLDIQDEGTRRWVCTTCVRKNNRIKPTSYIDKNLSNAKNHLVYDHRIVDPTGKLGPRGTKRKFQSIADHFVLDTADTADRKFANKMIRNFDRDHFQQLITNWVVEANLPFRVAEHRALREVLQYLNPAVATTDANMTGKTVARRIVAEYNKQKDIVIQKLKSCPGQIHIAFDGARSRNQNHTLWMKKGPVGKVHIWVVATHSSDILTRSLLELQRKELEESNNPDERHYKPLTVVLDVPTRWLSSFYMIKRALMLRRFYEHHRLEALQRWKRENPHTRGRVQSKAIYPLWLRDEARITDEDWVALQGFHDVLQPFHDTMVELEGDGRQRIRHDGTAKAFGLMPKVLLAFEFLLKTLESAKAALEQDQDGSMFAININLGWSKLNEYYSRLQESPAYYAALALHPRHRFHPFEKYWGKEHPDWVDGAKAAVKKLWLDDYSQLAVESPDEAPEPERTTILSAFQEFCSDSYLDLPTLHNGNGAIDEYEQWLNSIDPSDRTVTDGLKYWHDQRHKYPRLSIMALDVMTIPAMSADVERLFSDVGVMVSDRRSRLDATIISIAQVLRSWLRAGLV
ncbi:hypothetical protein S40293_09845 [Stachybotrys chartarum IBT 40293]|nr:hypothetical protein S40293_09845 [Stachybotrys chartarum IBT 40293]